jgi:hypothetical protein
LTNSAESGPIVMSAAGGDNEVCFIDLVLDDEGDELPEEEGASERLQGRSW